MLTTGRQLRPQVFRIGLGELAAVLGHGRGVLLRCATPELGESVITSPCPRPAPSGPGRTTGGQLNDRPDVSVRRHDEEDDEVDVVLHPVAGLRDRMQNGGLVRTAS